MDQSLNEKHLWEFRAVQDVFWIGLAILTFWFGYKLSGIFVPMLIGLGLAYVINPLLVHLESEWRWPRSMVIGSVMVIAVILLLLTGWIVVPHVADETQTLADRAPKYFETLAARLESSSHPLIVKSRAWVVKKLDSPIETAGAVGLENGLQTALQFLGSTLGIVAGIALVPIYFSFFAWYFQPLLQQSKSLIPSSRREPICKIVARMDKAVGSFLRGRFFVVGVMMVAFSLGFWLAEVPYWLLIGTCTGLISFIPYLSVVGALVAVLATWIEAESSGGNVSVMPVLVYPLAAFSVVQLLEGWLLTPWIQSQSMEMNPVVIIIVVLIGGSVGGLYGLLLAIPIAGCARILFTDVLLPRLQEWGNAPT